MTYSNKNIINNSKKKLFFYIVTICEVLLISLSLYFKNPFIVFAIFFFTILFIYLLQSSQNLFYLLLLYIVIFPNNSGLLRYPYLKHSASLPIIFFILIICLFISFIEKRNINNYLSSNINLDDKIIFSFFIWGFIAIFWGLVNNNPVHYIVIDFYFITLFLSFFIIKNSFVNKKKLLQVWLFIFVITVLVSIEYIYVTFREAKTTSMFITRVSTQQPHIAQVSIPFILSYNLFLKKRNHLLFSVILLLPIFLMIFFSQQRALWLGIFLSIIALFFLYYNQKGLKLKNIIKFLIIIILILAFFAVVILLVDYFLFDSALITLLERLESLTNLKEDTSLAIRLNEIKNALHNWKNNIFLGTGLGDSINLVTLHHVSPNIVDNSYIFVLWKTGIIGLILFLFLLLYFLQKGIKIYFTSQDTIIKTITSAAVSSLFGLMIIALTNVCLIHYRFIIIWSIILGSISICHKLHYNTKD
ncbi:MAG: O-antigen ligase family protein [bacterium]